METENVRKEDTKALNRDWNEWKNYLRVIFRRPTFRRAVT